MNAFVTILVTVFNAVGPSIVDFIKQAMSHPDIDDNGKAAITALGIQLDADVAAVDAVPPLQPKSE